MKTLENHEIVEKLKAGKVIELDVKNKNFNLVFSPTINLFIVTSRTGHDVNCASFNEHDFHVFLCDWLS